MDAIAPADRGPGVLRVVVVAGPDPGHAFPAVALCLRLTAAGHEAVLFTGTRWLAEARAAGVDARELPGLLVEAGDDDADAGQRLHARSARMSTALLPLLRALTPDVVVGDVLTACGGMAAERAGIPWVELSPHPLYLPSRGLPPIGSGLAVGVGVRGRSRDVLLRALTARSVRRGTRDRALARASVGLPPTDPGPAARLVATLPALEVPRPDWPANAHVVGPLTWELTTDVLVPPPGDAPLVLVSGSTAAVGATGVVAAALAGLRGVRVAATVLSAHDVPDDVAPWARVGPGRQDLLLAEAAVVVCGGGNGILAKALSAGVPVVVVPGGGDQWELAQRAARQGSAVVLRPLTPSALHDAVQRVLADPSYRAAAGRAAASGAGVADPVRVLEQVLGG